MASVVPYYVGSAFVEAAVVIEKHVFLGTSCTVPYLFEQEKDRTVRTYGLLF